MKKLLVLLTLLCSTFYLNAARKALVIGNGDYGQNSLSNAAKDARDFAQVLTSVGFKVTLKTDVELKEFEHTVDTFTASLKAVDEVVFYFSGHGIQYSGENFLIPARSDPKSEKDLKWDAMNANRISEYLNKAMVSIMILDCCRDNPFRNVRSSARGMATIEVIPGMQCVFYSTASGKTAEDGRGENSPFTAALLKFVAIPDLELDEVFRNVSKQVKEDTSNRQTPFRSGNLDEYFYFAKSSPVEERKPLDKPAEIPVAIPILSPAGGSYNTAQKVAITCATNGAAIRYTTNNTEPNAASTVYSSPLTVSNTTTIKAKGFKDGWTASPTASATYTITSSGTVATPTFNPLGEAYATAQSVSLSCATDGATIRYTTNNTEPTATSTLYSNPLTVSNTTTIKAKGFKDGWTASPTANATYIISSTPGQMIFVQGDSFKMGSNDGESDEKPVHQVTVSSYYIGKYEVTQKEWTAVMGSNPSYWKGDNLPVEQVSWYDAIDYCNKRSLKEGLKPCYSIGGNTKPSSWSSGTIACDWTANGYRLPTEAEWEYAARGGNKSKGYDYSGSNDINTVAWHYDNSGNKTRDVGTKSANELGIHDMSGNVWEWCWDWYDEEYYGKSPSSDPRGASSGDYRVLRGGSWNDCGRRLSGCPPQRLQSR